MTMVPEVVGRANNDRLITGLPIMCITILILTKILQINSLNSIVLNGAYNSLLQKDIIVTTISHLRGFFLLTYVQI